MTIYPAIDIKDGHCVRLFQGDFDTAHKVAEDALAVAASYQKAGFVHVVDLDGARDGVRKNAELVCQIVAAARPARVELGGGLRCMEDLAWADGAGVWRFVLGSAAVEDPAFVRAAVEAYGARVAVGIDARGGKVRTRGWMADSGWDDVSLAREMDALGVKTIIYTDIDTDGALKGPALERLRAVKEAVNCELVASGGVSSVRDVRALRMLGVEGCIIGKALYDGCLTLDEALFEAEHGKLFDKLKLLPAIIQNADTKAVLMLGYMNELALRLTLETKKATFWSRSREKLWVKGETSGHSLTVERVYSDCDDDTLLLLCCPEGPTCHTGSESCFFKEIPVASSEA